MFKFILKILTVFALLLTVSCAMEDEDADSTTDIRTEIDGYYNGNYTNFLVNSSSMLKPVSEQPIYANNGESGKLIEDTASFYLKPDFDFNSLDTARIFPNDTTFHEGIMNCIVNSYDMSYRIINSREKSIEYFSFFFVFVRINMKNNKNNRASIWQTASR